MTQKEFESRTGMILTSEEFEKINGMYLEAGNIDKDAFCSDYKEHSNSVLLNIYYEQSERLKNKLDSFRHKQTETAYFLIKKSMVGGDKDMITMAISLIGEQKYIQHKLEKGYNLLAVDKELIIKLINE